MQDGASLERQATYPAHKGAIKCLASAAGLLASGGADDLIHLYNVPVRFSAWGSLQGLMHGACSMLGMRLPGSGACVSSSSAAVCVALSFTCCAARTGHGVPHEPWRRRGDGAAVLHASRRRQPDAPPQRQVMPETSRTHRKSARAPLRLKQALSAPTSYMKLAHCESIPHPYAARSDVRPAL